VTTVDEPIFIFPNNDEIFFPSFGDFFGEIFFDGPPPNGEGDAESFSM
jgi:hypothetical protein